MKAAVWHGHKDLRIENVKEPQAKKDYVKIKVDYAGICGTDRHEYVGPNFIPVEKPHRLTGRVAPLIIGHEFSGTIVELGENVSGYSVGDRVTANGSLTCKECEMCRSGRYNICKKLGFLGVGEDGAFAEYVLVEAARLFKIPETVTQRQAVLAEPLACGIHATNIVGDVEGKTVVVIGPGIIGLSAFFAAKLKGAAKILVVGIGTDRKALIEKNGGEYFDTAKGNLLEYVEKWTDGNLADVVYECVGIQPTLNNAIVVTKPGGKIMVMGVFEKPPVVDLNTLQEAERTILTSQAHIDEIATALEYIRDGKINTEELVTGEVTLDNLVEDGFEELIKHPAENIKVIIKIA
ncbi:MAG: alcohol dehydrogenase catalytic domain-containing protein [Candidatus Metalachnospira sp.]|nr:alcohol dehydrogenase catalytic domain-containing protein [Candidatus Metalachnospira sp.]